MQNNVPGAHVGVSKIMRVIISFHVALRLVENSTLVQDVEGLGAGNVEKNIVLSTMIRSQVRGFLRQKIIMMLHVARRKKDMSGMPIVLGGIVRIVP